MLVPIVLIGLSLMVLERIFPDQKLPRIPRWWARVLLLNFCQLAIVVAAGYTWDRWLQRASVLDLGASFGPLAGGLIGYVVATFIYYWWHRVRHTNNFLWLLCHQVHHSPARIETITAFYKHPMELVINSIISSTANYALLGLTIEGAAWVTLFSGAAEFVYHMNIRTPHWMGYFLQRPEMHRIHHQRGKHFNNFADLPVWDWLFGTYQNPATYRGLCGYNLDRELQLGRMLCFKNVNNPLPKPRQTVRGNP
jgi:sterol desaturase/sphingolipid hydroxylase (fatty acid hydroxylase superfamily)